MENTIVASNSIMTYFDDITTFALIDNLPEEAVAKLIQIPFDYFKRDRLTKLRPISFEINDIIACPVFAKYNLSTQHISVNQDNLNEIRKLLFTGNPLKCQHRTIHSGIIGTGENYLIIITRENREGVAGRLAVLFD